MAALVFGEQARLPPYCSGSLWVCYFRIKNKSLFVSSFIFSNFEKEAKQVQELMHLVVIGKYQNKTGTCLYLLTTRFKEVNCCKVTRLAS